MQRQRRRAREGLKAVVIGKVDFVLRFDCARNKTLRFIVRLSSLDTNSLLYMEFGLSKSPAPAKSSVYAWSIPPQMLSR